MTLKTSLFPRVSVFPMGTTGRDTFPFPGQYNKLWGLREPGAIQEQSTSQMLKMKEDSARIQKLREVSPTIGHLSWYNYWSQLEIALSQMGFSITCKYVNPHILWSQQLEKRCRMAAIQMKSIYWNVLREGTIFFTYCWVF